MRNNTNCYDKNPLCFYHNKHKTKPPSEIPLTQHPLQCITLELDSFIFVYTDWLYFRTSSSRPEPAA